MKIALLTFSALALVALGVALWYCCGGVSHRELKAAVETESQSIQARLDLRAEALEEKVEALEKQVDARAGELEARLDRIEGKLDLLLERLTPRLPDGMTESR